MNSPASQLFCFSPRTWQFLPLLQHLQQSTTKGIMKCGRGHHFDTGKNLSLSRLFPTTIYPTQWTLTWPMCMHTFKEGTSYQELPSMVGCIALCEHSLKMAAQKMAAQDKVLLIYRLTQRRMDCIMWHYTRSCFLHIKYCSQHQSLKLHSSCVQVCQQCIVRGWG